MKKRCSKCGEVFEAEPDENWVIECTSCGARLRVRPKEPSPDEEEPARKTTSSSRIEKPQKTPSNASDRLKLPAVMRANKVVAGRTCPGCAEAIGLGTEVHNCDACGASHHAACWDAHGACASDECAAAPAKGRKGDREEEDEDEGEESDKKPCKFCGEMIKAAARKCRFCNEYQNARDRMAQEKRKENPEDADMSTGDWVAAVLCSTIGCIAGIIWCIQGKKKGPKMVGISLAFAILWNIVFAIIQAGQNPRYPR